MELNNQSIGSYMKTMRMRAGLTQHELTERISVGGRTVSEWERKPYAALYLRKSGGCVISNFVERKHVE